MPDGRTGRDRKVPGGWDGAFKEAFSPRPARAERARPPVPTDEEDSRYEIGDEIGRGGVGTVHRGHDRDLEREVAMKLLRTEHLDDDALIRRFVEEARVGGRLEHPGVVPVYGLGVPPDGRPWISMRLVEGGTFAGRMKRGAALHELLTIFERVALTVAYAHSRGIIHRDLKPGNVMVGAFGETLVVDWGFARVLGSDAESAGRIGTSPAAGPASGSASMAGDVVGTPGYMSPEQARGENDSLDGKTDVFALGAILCRILTGKPPFTGEATAALRATQEARLEEAFDRLDTSDGPEPLVALAKRCLAPASADRPSSSEVAEAVSEHLADVEERARRAELEAVAADARVARERRVRRLVLTLAGLVIAGMVGAGVVHRHLSRERDAREAEAAETVAAALLDTTRHETAGRWDAAVASAESALALARARDAGEDTVRRATARHARARRGADAARRKEARDRRFAALLAELGELRVEIYDAEAPMSSTDIERRIGEIFLRHEVGLDVGPPEEIGNRLRASAHAAEIAAALAEWSMASLTFDSVHRRRLLEIAAATDPEGRWSELLDVVETRSPDALTRFAYSLVEERARAPLLVATARALGALRRRAVAKLLLHTALAHRPDDVWVNRALAYEPTALRDAWIGPVRFRTTFVALRPDSARARTDLAWALGTFQAYEDAIDLAREAIRIDPELARAHTALGVSLVRTGDAEAGVAACEEAVRLAPLRFDVVAGLGLARLEAGDAEGAVEPLRAAIGISPGQPGTHFFLAQALLSTGRHDEAQEHAQQALARMGRGGNRRRVLALLEQIRAALAAEDRR